MGHLPLVSVLIVTWNRREDLRRSIHSALEQDYPNLEIVVLDNDSSDGSFQMVQDEFPSVTSVKADRNLGCPSGRNLGFKYCTGKYIYQLDDDGWLDPKAVSVAVERAESDAKIGVVMSSIMWTENGKTFNAPNSKEMVPLVRANFVGCCSMLRKSVLDEVGLYPDDFDRQGEESDLSIRMMDKGYICVYQPSSIMFHRPSPIGRNNKQIVFLTLRNKIKTALRLWPFPYNVLRVVNCFVNSPVRGLESKNLFMPIQLMLSVFGDLRSLKSLRSPVRRETLLRFRELEKSPQPIIDAPVL